MVVHTKINLLGCVPMYFGTQQHFGEIYCLHFQYVLSVCWYLHTKLHNITSHNSAVPIGIRKLCTVHALRYQTL
jgi:hypothetical protein